MVEIDVNAAAQAIRQPEWRKLIATLTKLYIPDLINSAVPMYPQANLVFEAFNYTDINDIRVVIIGQDPYQNPGLANGLAFSVPLNSPIPPSLRNIFKELSAEFPNTTPRTNTELHDWARQGVLLLNRTLTVREFESNSHEKLWHLMTSELVRQFASRTKNVVYMLWGKSAQSLAHLIDCDNNLILTHTHPSPLSRKPFVGNNHFKLANEYLVAHGSTPIKWLNDQQ